MSFWEELKRRKVVKASAAYLIAAWLIVQVVAQLTDPFDLPENLERGVIVVLALGFPFALILAWIYDLTPEGIHVTSETDTGSGGHARADRRLTYVMIGLLLAAVGLTGFRYIDFSPAPEGFGPGTWLAILPCAEENRGPEFFAAGFNRVLISRLNSTLNGLSVLDDGAVDEYANSSMSAREIADELDTDVDVVMRCDISYRESTVVVSLRLVDARTDEVLLSPEPYERGLGDITLVQSDIARDIADVLSLELSLERQADEDAGWTSSTRAQEHYFVARARNQLGDPDGILEALANLDQAIDLDPAFASAYSLRAFIDSQQLYFGAVDASARLQVTNDAYRDVSLALRMAPDLGLAHAAAAGLYEADWLWAQAHDAYLAALSLSPNDVDILLRYGMFNRALGDYETSIEALEGALALNPGDARFFSQRNISYMMDGQCDQALAGIEQMLEYRQDRNAYISKANCLNVQGLRVEALENLRLAESAATESGNLDNAFLLGRLVIGYAIAGASEDATRVFELLGEIETREAAVRAMTYIGLGDEDNALRWLQLAIEDPMDNDTLALVELKSNLWGLPMLETNAFRDLLDRIGAID